MKKLIITYAKNKKCAAQLENGKLIDLDILYGEEVSFLGNIYVGRVENVVSNINAAFVEIKKGVKCFFSLTDNPKPIFLNHKQNEKVCIGDLLLVRVIRDPIKLKMAVCDSSIAVSGKYVVVNDKGEIGVSNKITDEDKKKHLVSILSPLKKENLGFIVRTCAKDVTDELVINEANRLIELVNRIKSIARYRTAYTCLYNDNDMSILKNYKIDE